MAGRIQGVTVEIGGSTTKLDKALANVNRSIKNTQAQLKDVNKLLKMDPGNTDLMAQKQRLLGESITATKSKLESLKQAQVQAEVALKNGTITKDQYDALQREIVETTEELKKLEEEARKSATALQKIHATGEKFKEVGGKIEGVGRAFLPVTAAVAAAGTAAVKTTADFDSAMSKVSAVSGATGEDFDSLREKAREMGAKTKFSATEAAEGFNYMAMAGWKTGDMLDGIEGIMNLAAASGEDLASTSDIVTDALTAFGLKASDSGHFADILAAASSNANTNVSMMGETFKYAAPVAGALGFSAEDTAEAIGLMANAGIKSSQAGTSLRRIMTELNGEIKISGQNLGSVTIATSNADGSMRSLGDILGDCREAFSKLTESEQASTAETLVGKTAMSGFLAIMNAAPEDVNKLHNAISTCSDEIDGYNGQCEKMAAVMQDNLEGQLTILKSQLQELAISMGDILVPIVRDVVSAIQGFVDWLNSLDEGTKGVIVRIALFAAAIGPVLIVVGKVISAIGSIMTFIPTLVGGFTTLSGVVTGTIIPMAGAAITAITPFLPVIAAIAAGIAAVILVVRNWGAISEWFKGVWNALCAGIKTAWEGVTTFFTDTLPTFFSGLGAKWSEGWNKLKEQAGEIWGNIKKNATSFFGGIRDTITGAVSAARDRTRTVLGEMKNAYQTNGGGIKGIVAAVTTGIRSLNESMLSRLNAVTGGKLSELWSKFKEKFESIRSTVSGIMSGLISSAIQWGSDLVHGIADGIRNAIGAVKDAASNVASAVASFLHFSVPDEGPLSEYESWMPDFMKGLASSIEKSRALVQQAIGHVAGDMALTPQLATMGSTGGIMQSQREQLSLTPILDAIKGMKQGDQGDLVIPVYIGQDRIDEIVVTAAQRAAYRSGGR